MLLLESQRDGSTRKNEGNKPSINVNIASDTGVIMDVTIHRARGSKALVYNAYVSFVSNNMVLKITDLYPNILSELIRKYQDYIRGIAKRDKTKPQDSSKLSQALEEVKGVGDLISFVKDLTKIDINTIDACANKTIARTTIELDADIFTVLPQDVLDDSRLAILIKLQNCNTMLVNQIFESHIKIFSGILLRVDKLIKFVSVIPFALSLIPFFSTISDGSQLHAPVLPASLAVVSTFLYRYAPQIIFRYMPNILLRMAPKIISYLEKHKII
jgi:hypothetical protein